MTSAVLCWPLVLLLLLAALFPCSAYSAPADSEPPPAIAAQQHYHLALEAQSAHDFPAMLRLLRVASEEGSVPAQEMLGMVLIVGQNLYGKAVSANLCEAQMWTRRAAIQGSEIARFQVSFLNRLVQSRFAADPCAAWDRARLSRR